MTVKAYRPVWALLAMAALGLSACGSGEGISGAAQSMANAAIPPISATPPSVPLSQAKFAFAPVTGAPATVLTNISAELGKEAFAQQVSLVPVDDPAATYIVKGYLSAVGDASGTIVVYVWDVFDRSGKRVHRISGQETAPGAGVDPWRGVDRSTAMDVARQTISAIVAWGRSGPANAGAVASAPIAPAPAAVTATPVSATETQTLPATTALPPLPSSTIPAN
ncbi:hypothetical protein OSH08_19335 [Kaistia geumhonensis]|uniref:Lipoprotein n=1 Tax=Kaistia geumhonensis TaxID=410839 RepID=A0ABU0MBA0_9HYPH|nr:hypothetical protein [Kaistia geumhonensis]MCX5481162.1 hypothetical protein [Kaistia geumhonensis]MDQ0518223.1 hypothetical protein [Kaistia geumhonensis]